MRMMANIADLPYIWKLWTQIFVYVHDHAPAVSYITSCSVCIKWEEHVIYRFLAFIKSV